MYSHTNQARDCDSFGNWHGCEVEAGQLYPRVSPPLVLELWVATSTLKSRWPAQPTGIVSDPMTNHGFPARELYLAQQTVVFTDECDIRVYGFHHNTVATEGIIFPTGQVSGGVATDMQRVIQQSGNVIRSRWYNDYWYSAWRSYGEELLDEFTITAPQDGYYYLFAEGYVQSVGAGGGNLAIHVDGQTEKSLQVTNGYGQSRPLSAGFIYFPAGQHTIQLKSHHSCGNPCYSARKTQIAYRGMSVVYAFPNWYDQGLRCQDVLQSDLPSPTPTARPTNTPTPTATRTPTPATYTIAGQVTDEEGNPVEGVMVSVGSSQDRTLVDGRYEITDLASGTYTVMPLHPDYAFEPVEQSVFVGPNATGIDFTIKTFTISGYVWDVSGNSAIKDVDFWVIDHQTKEKVLRTPIIDVATGAYSLAGFHQGSYTLAPYKNSMTTLARQRQSASEDCVATTLTIEGVTITVCIQYIPLVQTVVVEEEDVEEVNFIDTAGELPDITPPETGFKGAGWLRFSDNYSGTNVGWNIEVSDQVADPVNGQTIGKHVVTLKQSKNIYTIYRLKTRRPDADKNQVFKDKLNCNGDFFQKWMEELDIQRANILEQITGDISAVPVFILGNEPNHFGDEWNYSASEYARLYNCYYQRWVKRDLEDNNDSRAYALYVAGPGQVGPCEIATDENGNEIRENGRPVPKWETCGNYSSFYQELLSSGSPTIVNTDGFALHAYGYYVKGFNGGTDIPDPNKPNNNGFVDWLNAGLDPIRQHETLKNKPIIITEYNPGAESHNLNEIKDGNWQAWFEKTLCWVQQRNQNQQIKGLLYFVDEQDQWRDLPSDPKFTERAWWKVALRQKDDNDQQEKGNRRTHWLNLDPAMDCTAHLGTTRAPRTKSSDNNIIGGLISGTLGEWGHDTVYYVTSDLELPVGETLTIVPGTKLVFSSTTRFTVAGRLIASGNRVRPIRFLSLDESGWGGIHVTDSSEASECIGCSLENIEFGGTALQIEAPFTFQYGQIRGVPQGTAIYSVVPFTMSNILLDYVGTGLYLSNTVTSHPYTVPHVTISRCAKGVHNRGQTVTVVNSILTSCVVGLTTEVTGSTRVSYTLLHHNIQNVVTDTTSELIWGAGLIDLPPNFVDFPHNFHLRADSPAVDRADPQADYSQELGYNGDRADLGAYGNTKEAPENPPFDQMSVRLSTDISQQQATLGQVISYTILLQNQGTVADSYSVFVDDRYNYDIDFQTGFYENGYDGAKYFRDMAPQSQTIITVWVRISDQASLSLSNTVTVQVIGRYGISDSLALTTLVPAYQEVTGQLVVEAENFIRLDNIDQTHWPIATSLPDYSGTGYLTALPDLGRRYSLTDTLIDQLERQYRVSFSTPGTYTVWVRAYAPNGAGDSLYVTLNEQPVQSMTGFAPRQWSWRTQDGTPQPVTLVVTEPGQYLLKFWPREDGIRLDKILLTLDGTYIPQGVGPAESHHQ